MGGMKVPLMPLARRKSAARGADLRVVDQNFADLVPVSVGLDRVGALGCGGRGGRGCGGGD